MQLLEVMGQNLLELEKKSDLEENLMIIKYIHSIISKKYFLVFSIACKSLGSSFLFLQEEEEKAEQTENPQLFLNPSEN